jgi:hypothetical protein
MAILMKQADMTNRMCSIVGCARPHRCAGYCDMHYRRWRNHGDPHYLSPQQISRALGVEIHFLSKIEKLTGGCWRWTGRLHHGDRYGVFTGCGVNAFAHRWAYEHWVAKIPPGLHLDHFRFPQDGCIGPACVNPEHVRPVTPRENSLRGDTGPAWNLAKTHCLRGHEFNAENTRIKGSSRICRACHNIAARERRRVTVPTTNPLTS